MMNITFMLKLNIGKYFISSNSYDWTIDDSTFFKTKNCQDKNKFNILHISCSLS